MYLSTAELHTHVLNLRDAVEDVLLRSSMDASFRSMVYSRICNSAREMCQNDAPSQIPFDPSIKMAPIPTNNDLFLAWTTATSETDRARIFE